MEKALELSSRFEKIFGTRPALLARGPGRVNLLGEHVDYNDGIVLPLAIDLAVSLAATPTGDKTVTLNALDLGECVSF